MTINMRNRLSTVPNEMLRARECKALENVELRATLEQAVEKANLNVTERMALNKKFFPNGGGFKLFPTDTNYGEFNLYLKKGTPATDEFVKAAESVEIPEHICRIKQHVYRSSKSSYSQNLQNALNKLKRVLQGNI